MTDTTFNNREIREVTLEMVEALTFEALSDRYARMMFLAFTGGWLLLAGLGAVVSIITGNHLLSLVGWWLLLLLVLPVIAAALLAPLIAASRGFALRERDIHYRSGIVWKKTVSLPFNRIQHIEVESGPIERFFNLSTLKFFTAGGSRTDMKIPGLSPDRSGRLRAHLIEKAGIEKDGNDAGA